MLTLAAYVLLLTVVIEGSMAQNYCQWSGIAHNSGSGNLKESAYYVSMYLFESSSCSGTSCTLNAVYPTVNRVADNVPASNVKYICDNQSHPAGSNTMVTGAQVAYICTCNGPYPASISVAVKSGALQIPCTNEDGNFCGPFPAQKQYCSQGGSYNGVLYSSCSVFESCDAQSTCVTNTTSTNIIDCDNASGGSGTYIQGSPGTGSASSSSTNYCRACTTDPNMNEKCAAKYGSSGGAVVLLRSSSSSVLRPVQPVTKVTSSSTTPSTIKPTTRSQTTTSPVVVAPVAIATTSSVQIAPQPVMPSAVSTSAIPIPVPINEASPISPISSSALALVTSVSPIATSTTQAPVTTALSPAVTTTSRTTTNFLPAVTSTSTSGATIQEISVTLGLTALFACLSL